MITAIILAGGAGSRMGGVDKGWVSFEGSPLITQVLQRISPQVDRTLISANRNLEQYQALGHLVISDDSDDFHGPMAGISAVTPHALATLSNADDFIMIVPCDMPFLPDNLVARLQATLVSGKGLSVTFAHDGTNPQLVIMMQARQLPLLQSAFSEGQRSIMAWCRQQGALATDFADCPAQLANINSLKSRLS